MKLPYNEMALMLTREPLDENEVGVELHLRDADVLLWFRAWYGRCEWPRVELRRGSEQ